MSHVFSRTTKFFIVIVVLAILGCEEGPPPQTLASKNSTAQVSVITVKPRKWQEKILCYGVVEAANEVDIAIDFSAKVEKINFKEGNRVERGQLLMTFDETKRSLRLKQAVTSVEAAKTRFEDAKLDLNRKKRLFEGGNVPRAELDASELALRRATAMYQDAKAANRIAIQELRECKLYSPVDGIVEKKMIHPGETAILGIPLVRIQVSDTLRVTSYVSEKEINHLRVGGKAEISSPGVRGKIYHALIESLGVKADDRTGNFPVKLTIQNDDEMLRPGMTARISMTGLELDDALVVPQSAITDRNRRKVLYIIKDNKASEVEPVFEVSAGEEVLVIEGVAEGDQVITAGLSYVIHGSKVRVVEN